MTDDLDRIVNEEGGTSPVSRRAPRADVVRPEVAVPTLILFAVLATTWGISTWAALGGHASAWVSIPINAFVSFGMFTVLHDATHRGLGKLRWVNEVVGRMAMPFVSINASFGLFRFIHLTHHRYVNEGQGRDPDHWVSHGPTWQMPVRWAMVDIGYIVFYLRNMRERPSREVIGTMSVLIGSTALLVVAAGAGFLDELLLVYIVPQRIALGVLAWWFDWLPHHGLVATNQGNRFQATRNIIGFERILTPLLFSQNYHLVHHIHPIIPFYRYVAAWRRNEEAYLTHEPALSSVTMRPLSMAEYRTRRGLPPAA